MYTVARTYILCTVARSTVLQIIGKAKSSRVKAVMKWWTKCISMVIVIAKTASSSRNVAFKSDKIMDALFRECQSVPQTPQPFFDADTLTSKAWPATRSCISLIRLIVRNRPVLISATYRFMHYMLCKVISANTTLLAARRLILY